MTHASDDTAESLIGRDVVCKPDPRLGSSDKRYVSTAESDLGMQTFRMSFLVVRGHFYVIRGVALPDETASFAFVGPSREKKDPEWNHSRIPLREMLP